MYGILRVPLLLFVSHGGSFARSMCLPALGWHLASGTLDSELWSSPCSHSPLSAQCRHCLLPLVLNCLRFTPATGSSNQLAQSAHFISRCSSDAFPIDSRVATIRCIAPPPLSFNRLLFCCSGRLLVVQDQGRRKAKKREKECQIRLAQSLTASQLSIPVEHPS